MEPRGTTSLWTAAGAFPAGAATGRTTPKYLFPGWMAAPMSMGLAPAEPAGAPATTAIRVMVGFSALTDCAPIVSSYATFRFGKFPETDGTFVWSVATVETSTPYARAAYASRSAKVCAIIVTPMRRCPAWKTKTTKPTAVEGS